MKKKRTEKAKYLKEKIMYKHLTETNYIKCGNLQDRPI